jgi:hypothetical protein
MQLILMLLLFSNQVFAGESFSEYKNTEAMGRGNSTISWSNSKITNVFYNPSFLSDDNSFSFEVLDTTIDLSNNSIGLISHIPQVKNGETYSALHSYFGNSFAVQGYSSPVVSYKGFTLIPLFASGLGSATIRNPVFSSADAFYYKDFGTALGKGITINKNLSLGVSAMFYKRSAELDSASLVNLLRLPKPTERSGQTFAFNAGLNYNFKNDSNTIIGFNWLNIGSPVLWQNRFGTEDEVLVSSLREQMGLGVSTRFFPVPYFEKKIKWSVEFRNFTDPNLSFIEKITLGLQYDLASWFHISCGVYDKAPTFGLDISSRLITLNLSTYGEDSGIGYESINRHYSIGLKFGFE